MPSGAVPSWYRLMVTPGTSGSQLVCSRSCGSSNGRVEAYTTCPRMPPFSPGLYGVLPNSTKEFWPEKPCQPSLTTHGGSIRPVESVVEQVVTPVVGLVVQELGASLLLGPFLIDLLVQSAVAQYTAPGTRKFVGTDTCSTVFAIMLAMAEVPHGAVGGVALLPHSVPSAGPPASYTTCVPAEPRGMPASGAGLASR